MTGPEAGQIFWNGDYTGSTPNFAFWNTNEPNNLNDEDYAHVTAPGIGITGSWNDLQITGDPSGDYEPKGYIVEYGGMWRNVEEYGGIWWNMVEYGGIWWNTEEY